MAEITPAELKEQTVTTDKTEGNASEKKPDALVLDQIKPGQTSELPKGPVDAPSNTDLPKFNVDGKSERNALGLVRPGKKGDKPASAAVPVPLEITDNSKTEVKAGATAPEGDATASPTVVEADKTVVPAADQAASPSVTAGDAAAVPTAADPIAVDENFTPGSLATDKATTPAMEDKVIFPPANDPIAVDALADKVVTPAADSATPPAPADVVKPVEAAQPAEITPLPLEIPQNVPIQFAAAAFKTRNIDRTENKLTITTVTQEGSTVLSQKDGAWFIKTPLGELPFPGEVKVEDNNDVLIRMAGEKDWRREHADGRVGKETLREDGVRIAVDSDNQAYRIAKSDGSVIERVNENTIVESKPGEKPETWTKQGDVWKSDLDPTKERQELALNQDGSISFKTTDGVQHNITASGTDIRSGEGLVQLKLDGADRVHSALKVDKKEERKYEYFDSTSNDVKSLTLVDQEKGTSKTFSRDSKTSLGWTIKDASGRITGNWYGEIGVAKDGTHGYREASKDAYNRLTRPAADKPWELSLPDGQTSQGQLKIEAPIAAKKVVETAPVIAKLPDNFKLAIQGPESTNTPFNAALAEASLVKGEKGFVDDINYPSGRTRHLDRDANNEVNGINTKDANGSYRLAKKDGNWFVQMQGYEVPFPGKVQVEENGDISFQTANDGSWRRERADDSVVTETTNTEGARICLNPDGAVQHVSRANGSTVSKLDDSTIIETRPGQKPLKWTKEADVWNSDSADAGSRKNFEILKNGALSFETADGIKHRLTTTGIDIREGENLPKIKLDEANRFVDTENPSTNKRRHYEYFDSNSRDIKSVAITDLATGKTTTFSREKADSWDWNQTDAEGKALAKWQGEIRVSEDGVHSYRVANRDRYGRIAAHGADDKWNSQQLDGRETKDIIRDDGSRYAYDDKNNFVGLRRADGFKIDKAETKDGAKVSIYDPLTNETVNWSKNAEGQWSSDSAKFTDIRKDLNFDPSGNLFFGNEAGNKVMLRPDATRQVTLSDNTQVEMDKGMHPVSARKGNLLRTFGYDQNGDINTVKDLNLANKQERLVFQREEPETRTDIKVNDVGDLSYINSDEKAATEGKAVIERSSMVRLELGVKLDQNNQPDVFLQRAITAKSARSYQYEGEGKDRIVTAITDTRTTPTGDRTESWGRLKVEKTKEDGTTESVWSEEFRCLSQKGESKPARFNITPCADGEYEYRKLSDKPGDKVHIARVGRESLEDGIPEDAEDARLGFLENLEGRLEAKQVKEIEAQTIIFKNRMELQHKLMMRGGIDPELARKECDRAMAGFYHHSNKLALTENKAGQKYDQATRLKLMENLVYMAANPSKVIVQSPTGTCWWESSWNVGGAQRHMDQLARLVTDVALTKQYTSTAGPISGGRPVTVVVPEGAAVISAKNYSWKPSDIDKKSDRSPVGQILDVVGTVVGGRSFQRGPNAGAYGEARNTIYMITGVESLRHGGSALGKYEEQQLLFAGGHVNSNGRHMWGNTAELDPRDKTGNTVRFFRDDQYAQRDQPIATFRLDKPVDTEMKKQIASVWKQARPASNEKPVVVTESNYRPSNRPNNPNRPRIFNWFR